MNITTLEVRGPAALPQNRAGTASLHALRKHGAKRLAACRSVRVAWHDRAAARKAHRCAVGAHFWPLGCWRECRWLSRPPFLQGFDAFKATLETAPGSGTSRVDLVLSCVDNYEARMTINQVRPCSCCRCAGGLAHLCECIFARSGWSEHARQGAAWFVLCSAH